MSIITIKSGTAIPVNWSANGKERVAQNAQNLLSIVPYEIAFDRTLGLPTSLIDTPSTNLINNIEAQVVDLIEHNEPRAKVISVSVIGEAEGGQMQFEVVIENAG